MNYSLVIAAHNEEDFIIDCLNSVFSQTVLPKEVVVVNDNSTDRTETLLGEFQSNQSALKVLNHCSSSDHMPGSKVVAAFNYGLQEIDLDSIDLIVKLDADIILPSNYFEEVINCFQSDTQIGIAGGFAYELDKNGTWKLNHPMDKNHVRGAFKTYSVDCFLKMNGLRIAMGWDTADELLAQYHGYQIKTLDHLKVKHLRPLGKAYHKKAKLLQGKAMYGLRYGLTLCLIASFKSAYKQARLKLIIDQLQGYLKAKKEKAPYLVTEAEGAYIRNFRWNRIFKKLIP